MTKNMMITAVDFRLKRICIVRSDITEGLAEERGERKKLEKALDEAEAANRAKSDFLSSMSHDIRTPMNAIMGMTTLALNNMESINIRHPFFIGDALRLKQIFINLLGNAFKFTMEGGYVWFRVEEIPASAYKKVRYRFCVQDTGIGMSENFVKCLFEPFVRDKKVSEVEGTGLGLSITKGLVELMGGQIQVESKLKEGTAFYVELEFEEADKRTIDVSHTQSETDEKEQNLNGCHFLIAEDNEINAEILGELLQVWGAEFTVKRDGFQAVEEFRNSKPGTYDMIFMNVQMPVMNGYEATKIIRSLSRPDAKEIMILAMTANAFAEDIQAALEAGMNRHIAKPLDEGLLYNTISQLLKKR